MSDATAEHPDSLGVMVAHAWEAYHAADWLESYARWERVRASYPNYPPPYIHGGNSLRQAGQLEAALEKLECGSGLFPDHPQLVTSIAACLDQMEHFTQLSQRMETDIPRFPENPEVAIDYIRMAHMRNDYRSVIHGVNIMGRVHPDRLESDNGLRHMASNARLHHEMSLMDGVIAEDMVTTPPIEFASLTDRLVAKELMLAFESLGENCEFGLVQRHFQVEPLGLLRWAATSVYSLTLALDETFEGVGVAEHTKLHGDSHEYAVTHDKYGMGSHTFIHVDKNNEQSIFRKMVTRLGFLRKKLIEDLEAGEKIFVYSCETGTTERELMAFHKALKRYGSRYLLFVVKSDEENKPGTVRDAGDGLMIGYNDRLGPDRLPSGHVWNVSFDHWLQICRTAYDMRRRDQAISAAVGMEPEATEDGPPPHASLPVIEMPSEQLAVMLAPSPFTAPLGELSSVVDATPKQQEHLDVHSYAEHPETPVQQTIHRRFQKLVARLGGRSSQASKIAQSADTHH